MSKRMKKLTVILEPEKDSAYSVHCPSLPGCVSQGDDRQSALENIKEAIVLVLEAVQQDKANSRPQLSSESPKTIANAVFEVPESRREEGLPMTIETVEVEV